MSNHSTAEPELIYARKDEIEKMRAEHLRLLDALDEITMERNRLRRIIEHLCPDKSDDV